MKNLKMKSLKYTRGRYEFFDDRVIMFPPQILDILSSIYGEGVKSWCGLERKQDGRLYRDGRKF